MVANLLEKSVNIINDILGDRVVKVSWGEILNIFSKFSGNMIFLSKKLSGLKNVPYLATLMKKIW